MTLSIANKNRRPTPISRLTIPRHDPSTTRSLGDASMWLEDTRRANRFELVAGNATGGLLRPATQARSAMPAVGQRLTLLGGRSAPVRFVVQVDDVLIRNGESVVSVRWVVLSGPGTGGELQGILRTVLGVQADVVDSIPARLGAAQKRPAAAGTRRRLVYQAERKTLRSMSTAAPVVG